MRLAKCDTVAGMPAPVAREIARRFFRERPEQVVDDIVAKDQRGAALQAMAEVGYLEFVRETKWDRWWITTTEGNALAQASFARPITRRTADRLVAGLVERARVINADPASLLSVRRLRIFGSYLHEDVDRLGDVDVELVIARRLPGRDYVEAARKYTKESGRESSDRMAYLGWPETELRRKLTNRSTALSITLEDADVLTDRVRTIYWIESDPDALPVSAEGL